MAGACWVMPQFHKRLGKEEMITTFKSYMERRLDRAGGDETDRQFKAKAEEVVALIRDVWGPGGAVRRIKTKACPGLSLLCPAALHSNTPPRART